MNTVRVRTISWIDAMRVAAVVVAVCGAIVQLVLERSFIPPLTILDIALVVGAVRGSRLIMGLTSVVFVVLAVPFDLPHLTHPDSWLPFVVATASVVGAVIGLAGLIAMRADGLADRAQTVAGLGLAVVAAAAVIGGIASAAASSDRARPGDIVLRASGIAYKPSRLTAVAGAISVDVVNRDLVTHTYAVDGLGVDITVPAGKSRRVTFDAAAGQYRFRCTIAGHDNMKGTLVVN